MLRKPQDVSENMVDSFDKVIVRIYDNSGVLINEGLLINSFNIVDIHSNLEIIDINLLTKVYSQTISIKTQNIKYIKTAKHISSDTKKCLKIIIHLKDENEVEDNEIESNQKKGLENNKKEIN